MYKKIFIAIDNSHHSNACIDHGIALSKKFNSHLVGCHVYDASLHQRRFRDMEKGLPPQYQDETELQRQRNLHTSLINLGLKLISESYLDVFKNKCREASVPHEGLLLEGKNYHEIIQEVRRNHYDLVILGAFGLASINEDIIGSVCERVVRRVPTDVLVVKDKDLEGKVVVAVDGSVQSLAGINSALHFTKSFHMKTTAVSVFDPHYHRVAFDSIAKVLSKEAGQIFRFREQETLHEEIIDKGLAKIYQNHLDCASVMARDAGAEICTTLMDGKPYDQILKYIYREKPSLLIVGRTGIHNTNDLDLGSTAENLLRLAPCNILLTSGNVGAKLENSMTCSESRRILDRKTNSVSDTSKSANENKFFRPNDAEKRSAEKTITRDQEHTLVEWTQEAQIQAERIPSFIREFVKKKIEEYALQKGYREISSKVVDEAKAELMNNGSFH